MKIRRIFAVCLSAFLVITAGCSASGGDRISGTIPGSSANSSSSGVPESSIMVSSAAASGAGSEPGSSNGEVSSKTNAAASTTQSGSKVSSNNNDWVAYDTNKDNYKLHIKRADGSEDKVIVKDIVLAPCVAGEWVYYINPLIEIDKVKLDGSQRTKVCDIPEMMHLNGNMSVTVEYQDGYILYKTQQLHEVGNSSSYPAHYYKLDPDTDKITEVKS